MRRSDELQEALRALGEKHRAVVAPADLEMRLRAAVRVKDGPWIRWRIPAMAAAAVLALLLVRVRHPAAVDRMVHPTARVAVASFVMLPASLGLPRPEATSIVRLEMRKGDLRQYGFDVPPPVADQLIRADFVVGEDGLARAVRLVE